MIGDKSEIEDEITGIGVEKETPVAARKTNRPSLLFYVGAGILVCVGAALFFTRKK